MDIIPDKRKVVGLVEQAHEGKICLPNFQRDFVWTREEVADLVRSIVRGYFIGSLLLLRCDANNPPFAPVFLRGTAPANREPRPELLVLDGQQRLSSLVYALTAPDLSLKDSSKRRWFFVNLDVLLSEPDSDDVVFDRSKRELRGLDSAEEQYTQRMLPCEVLLTQQGFYRWRDGFEDWLRRTDPDQLDQYRTEWRDGWTSAVTGFQTFEVPLVELPRVDDSDSESIGRVCAIFEKLNSTGVDLSVYDLLTARLYRSNIRLHDLWAEAVQAHPLLRTWSKGKADEHKFGVLVLRTLALLRGLDPKPRILIDLSPESFDDDWRRAAAAMERALELITLVGADGFGVFNEKWLPGFGLIPILAALRAEIDERRLGEQERADLRRWYWCNVFMERYSSAVESKSRKDYLEMTRHWLEDGPEPEVFREAADLIGAPGFRIRDSASYASARYSGVFCLLALRAARDWRRGEDIRLQELQDHHIFPKAYLKRHEITKRVDVNTVANRTLISDETNGKIKDKAPADYLGDDDIFPSGARADLLDPHFIDESTLPMVEAALEDVPDDELADLYERFAHGRQAAMIEEIRRVCGITAVSPDTPEADEPDEVAADVKAGTSPSDDELELEDLELENVGS
ncbi:MAG: GmrSD restriction endonuclease domain-containing protein [Solirubrobacterales bacterium]